ncbi:spore coat protein [Ureibacillus aquaedulcis]|uniref:Spore coat protein n=1 Tax=Ureibacillus aquaedulcis TaxID=3058421 RepID=A0ABT8GQ65_9BACL|nr:spore coat protein [Ureibacillus sp. BA0131]MDN4493540.1 spore coat protein [Ureibacillus sp. BA0131]
MATEMESVMVAETESVMAMDARPMKTNRKNWHEDAFVDQEFDQIFKMQQESNEVIWIKDSCDVEVKTTDTQAAVSLQVGLQLAIALVISISLGDSDQGRAVAQDIFQKFDDEQINRQRIYVDNSKDVHIHTTDTDLSVSIQALLQVLLTLVVKIDVL